MIGGTFSPVMEANLPASDPLVLAVGGTSLTAGQGRGAYISESSWGLPFGDPGSHFQASGGGLGRLFARPPYQHGIPGLRAHRGVPDVAATASPHTALAVVTSTGDADQYARRHLGFVNAGLYRIGRSSRYHRAIHDVTAGSNSVRFPPRTINGYRAAPGWDPVTGWASPNANVLVPLLARSVHLDHSKGL